METLTLCCALSYQYIFQSIKSAFHQCNHNVKEETGIDTVHILLVRRKRRNSNRSIAVAAQGYKYQTLHPT